MTARKLALVTGVSTGIGPELARCRAADGTDLIVAGELGSPAARSGVERMRAAIGSDRH